MNTTTKNNLQLLTLDEPIREKIENTKRINDMIAACKVLGLTLDMASSDVVCYVVNKWNESLCIG